MSIASGPTFVKSTATTLFEDEENIKYSRQKKAKVTFAKPRAKQVAEAGADENFVRKDSQVNRDKKDKLAKLEGQVDQLYGSKAYRML